MKVIPWDGKPISAPGIYSGVPMSVYHGADLCVGPSISSSGLRRIFSDSALHYFVHSPYNPNCVPEPPKEAYILGRGAHHLVLGESHFAREFVLRPERIHDPKAGEVDWNSNRTVCKEWLRHCEDQGLTVLTPAQVESIKGMAGLLPWQAGIEDCGLANTPIVRAGALSGLVEHTIIAIDAETGVFLKARPDAIPVASTEANDFKTSESVTDRAIQKTLDEYRYDMQADLVARCLLQAADVGLTSFALIFAMKKVPHATRIVELKGCDLALAADDNAIAIRTFARCMETGRWPGPGGSAGDAAFIERSSFSRERAANRRAFLEMELAA